jgi:hypothetical protein
MNKLIIAGGRKFNNYKLLSKEVKKFVVDHKLKPLTIISGKASGADSLGEKFAEEYNIPVIEKPANWDDIEGRPKKEIGQARYGKPYWKLAGLIRNEEMAKEATHCICFWDGKSTGTKDMIKLADEYDLIYHVVNY